MAANTSERLAIARKIDIAIYDEAPIATSAVVYCGNLVNFNTAGRLVDATAAASRRFAGMLTQILNDSGVIVSSGTGNLGGTVKGLFRFNNEELLDVATSTRTTTALGKIVYVADNHTVRGTGVGTAGVRVAVGAIGSFYSSSDKTQAWVQLRHLSTTDIAP